MNIPKILALSFLLLKAAGTAPAQTYPTYPTWAQHGTNTYPNNLATNYPPIPSPASFPTLPDPISAPSDRPALTFAIVRSSGTLWSEVTVRGRTWTTYVLESSTDLKTWIKLTEVKTGILGGGVVRVPFEVSSSQKFFRLKK
ncbi:MAG: hypothetical protein Q7S86_01725 [bacterium]|nr:hypothetical protein [bacterium]